MRQAISPERVLGGIVYSANEVVAPGVVKNFVSGRNMLTLGEPDDSVSPRIKNLRAILDAAGMPSPPVKQIRGSIWSKLVLNLGNSMLCLLTGENIAGVRGNPQLSKVPELLKKEGEAIAVAHGIVAGGRAAAPWRRAQLGHDRPQAFHAAGLRARPSDGDRVAARRRTLAFAAARAFGADARSAGAAVRAQGEVERALCVTFS